MTEVYFDELSLLYSQESSMEFHDTTFFQINSLGSPVPRLPTPAEVRKVWPHGRGQGGTARFDDLDLFVKFGPPSYARVEEALALRAVNKAYSDKEVPAPELFGWKMDGGETFIYMSLVRGTNARESWNVFTREDKEALVDQLGKIVVQLRRLVRPSSIPLICSVNGNAVSDLYLRHKHIDGPFSDVKTFNDALSVITAPYIPALGRLPDTYRSYLPDTANVYFSHGDLNLSNIIMSDTLGVGPRKILAIVDWEQAGWYPEYWEYCKLNIGENYGKEWRAAGWADQVMTVYEAERIALWPLSEYRQWR
ncbi:kinase-like domain-containing protein [Hypomontagnella monticulosa]|nr:kinase-like domain-containing protein [Hypomontagnella monticulosa]